VLIKKLTVIWQCQNGWPENLPLSHISRNRYLNTVIERLNLKADTITGMCEETTAALQSLHISLVK